MNTKLLPTLALLTLAPLAVTAQVETVSSPGPWSISIKTTYLETTDGSDANPGAGLPTKDLVAVEDKLIPEFDIRYQINDFFALELVLTIPQEHEVKVAGVPSGDFKHLPPTLMGKYYPGTFAGLKPYVGAGVNFTLIYDENLGGLELDSYSVGPAVQLGADYALNDRWALTVDVKRVMLRSDVELNGAKVTEVQLDPWLYALGLTYQF